MGQDRGPSASRDRVREPTDKRDHSKANPGTMGKQQLWILFTPKLKFRPDHGPSRFAPELCEDRSILRVTAQSPLLFYYENVLDELVESHGMISDTCENMRMVSDYSLARLNWPVFR